jgi:flagellar biosynthesis regulator FlaF
MNYYIKWIGRRVEPGEDKDKGLPVGYLGRTMVSHGEEFQADSEFGNSLITVGRANERISAIQESFVAEATASWLETLDRSLAMMKEYQNARKKLESRRLAYDASITKIQKAKRDDFRLEEELRAAKAKYEESSEDVLRRMQDIQDAESDSIRGLNQFLDAELDYHERCAEELRRVRNNLGSVQSMGSMDGYGRVDRRPTGRGRSNTGSRANPYSISEVDERESSAPPVRMPPRANTSFVAPTIGRANSFQGGASLERERGGGRISGSSTPNPIRSVNQGIPDVGSLRGQLRPVSKIVTTRDDVFADRDFDTASDTGSPDWGTRSTSPETSIGSLSRTSSNAAVNVSGLGSRKAPPPPPPSRSKKPPPPVPARRDTGY